MDDSLAVPLRRHFDRLHLSVADAGPSLSSEKASGWEYWRSIEPQCSPALNNYAAVTPLSYLWLSKVIAMVAQTIGCGILRFGHSYY